MRRTIAASLLAMVTVSAGLTSQTATAQAGHAGTPSDQASEVAASQVADALGLATNDRASATKTGIERQDYSLKLASMFAGYDQLAAAGKRNADAALGRPTQGASDPYNDGYSVHEATPICGSHVCLHYVKSTTDAPPLTDDNADGIPDWVRHNLDVMESVWGYEVNKLGYRAPAKDTNAPHHGPDGRFDVYLANLGDQGLYGYCAPEWRVGSQKNRASGFCVLDNDFSTAEFGAPPNNSLRVTAAHEFFHAIQFNYDYNEDHWIMEVSSTWMEERYADDVNDNRQYIAYGQEKKPGIPLDVFQSSGLAQYGNWVFFERLTKKYGFGAVKNIWSRLDGTNGKPNNYSIQGVKNYLKSKGMAFPKFYAWFGAGNIFPKTFYSEGAATAYQPGAPIAKAWRFTSSKRYLSWQKTTLQHLSNRNFAFLTDATLTGAWHLKIKVNGPGLASGTAAQVIVVSKAGKLTPKIVKLNSKGDGTIIVNFSGGTIAGVSLTLANGSTRFNCNKGTAYSCHGTPLDNNRNFSFSAVAAR